MSRNLARLNSSDEVSVTVLVSIGKHPVTGRLRRADQDARALEMALGLSDAEPRVIYAGPLNDSTEPALRGYLGMGISELKVLRQSEQNDIVPALSGFLDNSPSSLILCGSRAELGESSGLVPYQLADVLGYTLVANVAVIEEVTATQAVVLQALPRGQRRRIEVVLPAILAVDTASPVARQVAYAKASRGFINCVVTDAAEDDATEQWHYQPARKRPKRLKIIKATSARDRFKAAAAKAEGTGGQVLTSVSAEEGAAAILKVLKEEGVLKT